jgi:AcrR family transcriptional regulator
VTIERAREPGSRREQILAKAAELFAARGFHGVSVADLGAACGISGPALYKHFVSKDAVLAEMLVTISQELLAVGSTRVAAAADPAAAVAALVDWHVEFALRHRPLIVVQDRDWESLPGPARERVRALQREYVDLWAGQLRAVHDRRSSAPAGAGLSPDALLSPDAARAMAHAAFGLINSTPHSGLLPDEDMHALLRRMALGALGVPQA